MAKVIRREREAELWTTHDDVRKGPGDYDRDVEFWQGTKRTRTSKSYEFTGLIPKEEGDRLMAASQDTPQHLSDRDGRSWWLYNGDVYSTAEEDLDPDEVQALIEEKANKRKLKIARAKTIASMADGLDRTGHRQPIPREIKVAVWQRDKGACVHCGSNAMLEYDHIVPLALGGSNTERNLQLLCEACNREKGASL